MSAELGTENLQRADGGPPRGRPSEDPIPCRRPAEVLRPSLRPGVEEADNLARVGVDGDDPVALVRVAEPTSDPEVRFFRGPAQRLGDDVLDLHRRPDD